MTDQLALFAEVFDGPTPVVLSYGMGVDSTAILLRWLVDPSSRDFDLADLTVVTAMVGDEYAETGDLVASFILPRLRSAGVRFVQLGRGGRLESAGVAVLDDSTAPDAVHLRGAYRLSDEMREAGTIPQVASGRRLCSVKFKGWVIDSWLAAEYGRRPYRHVMGFNADEQFRVDRDSSYSTVTRLSEYPLLTWGWGRAFCEWYIESVTGRAWVKSCCTFCPFASNRESLPATLNRYRREPEAGVSALAMEHLSVALNPRSTLFAGRSVQALVAADNPGLASSFAAQVVEAPHSLYEVRRVIPARTGDATKKGRAMRSIRVHATGTLAEMIAALEVAAADAGVSVTTDEYGIVRATIRTRADVLPVVEHEYVAGPAGAATKEQPAFAAAWAKATRE